jgi:hypothetical protein
VAVNCNSDFVACEQKRFEWENARLRELENKKKENKKKREHEKSE